MHEKQSGWMTCKKNLSEGLDPSIVYPCIRISLLVLLLTSDMLLF